jgi:N-acyl-D-amino-acid deacylase
LIPDFEPDPSLAGKTLAEIAALRGTDPATTLIELIRESEALRAERKAKGEDEDVESVIAVSMKEDDIERLMAWPHINFCTDGGLVGSHPRGFGSFPRVLGHYVRERQVMTLEEALRSGDGGRPVHHREPPRPFRRHRKGVGQRPPGLSGWIGKRPEVRQGVASRAELTRRRHG